MTIYPLRNDVGIQFLEKSCTAGSTPPLRRIGFTITYSCDGNCTYCFAKPQHSQKESEISLAEFEDILKQALPLGLEEVQLSGGEPLLKKDVPDFVRAAKAAGIRVGLFTNASMLDKKTAVKLKKIGLDWLRISLGGSTPEMSQRAGRLFDTKERFARILENIRLCARHLSVGVFTPVTKNNCLDIRKTAVLAGNLGVKYIIFCNYILLGNSQDSLNMMSIEEHYKAIEEIIAARREQKGNLNVYAYFGFFEYLSPNWNESDVVLKAPCGRERLAFDANGAVKTCLCTVHALDYFRRKGFSLKELWEKHPLLLSLRKKQKFEPCLHCKRSSICQPCSTPIINLSNEINKPPPQCPAVREYASFRGSMSKKDALRRALRHNLK